MEENFEMKPSGVTKTEDNSDSDRKTPSSNSDAGSLRADTPGPVPKYIYTKKDLMGIAQSPASKRRPIYLQTDYDTTDGYWDPEKWSRSFDRDTNSRGSSPLTFSGSRDRKRPPESDRDLYKRRVTVDPKTRVREEEEDLGIVLSPQRRSFGTGCHVITSNKIRPGSPTDTDPRERRDRAERRIGSGRIQIDRDRDRDIRERDRDPRERDRDPRDRDHRDIRDRDRDMRDRDHRDMRDRDDRRDMRDFRDSRGRFDRDDRRSFDRSDHFRRDDPRDFRDRRDIRDRRYAGRRRYQDDEVEPEWFSGGPTSQTDTIELRGFEEPKKEHDVEEEDEGDEKEEEFKDAVEEPTNVSPKVKRHAEPVEKSTANGNAEKHVNETVATQPFLEAHLGPDVGFPAQDMRSDSPALPRGTDFDFNQIFNIEHIPGLSVDLPLFGNTDLGTQDTSGSKFSQWFHGETPGSGSSLFGNVGSQGDSRRSSINEGEFGYLNDLLGGQKTPTGPSPPPHMMGARVTQSNLFTHFTGLDMKDVHPREHHQETNILELLHNAKMNVVSQSQEEAMLMNHLVDSQASLEPVRPRPKGGVMVSDLERDLKAMIGANVQKFNGRTSPLPQSRPNTVVPPPLPKIGLDLPGKITTVAELEANLKEMDLSNNNRHKNMPVSGHMPNSGIRSGMPPPNMPSTHPAHQRGAGVASNVGPGQLMHQPHQRNNGLQGAQQIPQQPSPTDMTAFNKLLGMMKQAGTLEQAQKEMQKVAEGRVSPPQQVGPLHQQQGPMQLGPPNGALHGASGQQQQPQIPSNQMNTHYQKDLIQQLLSKQNIQQNIHQKLQQQQAKLKQQQQQQQQQMQEQILKFVKQNPAIITPKAPTSPCPTALAAVAAAATLQPPAAGSALQPPSGSPRCPSPIMPGLLQQPQPSSPRAPSPIMFGSQPPMHLTAPSPIHASQLQAPPSPNTLQVTGQANKQIARVPSPQELVAHTQAIMQNALIKKQLEDQKERFLRKQQDGGKVKSPNAPVTSGQTQFQFPNTNMTSKSVPGVVSNTSSPSFGSLPASAHATAVSSTQSKVLPAFTPTSVIRKLANEKAEAKEFGREEEPDGMERNVPDNKHLMRPGQVPQVVLQADTPPHPGTPGSVSSEGGGMVNVPISLQQQLQQIQDPKQQQALINTHMLEQQEQQVFMQNHPCMPGQPQLANMDPKRRPLIGQGTMQHPGIASTAPSQNSPMCGRAIVKGSIMSPPSGTPPVATVQPQQLQAQPARPLQAGAGQGVAQNSSVSHTMVTSQQSQQRAIIGSQGSTGVMPSTSSSTAGAMDVTKMLEQQRLQQQSVLDQQRLQQQQPPSQQRISPTSPNMQRQAAAVATNQTVLNAQFAAAAAQRLSGVQAGIVRPGLPAVNTAAVANAAAANALLMQRMMQSGGMQNPVRAGLPPQAAVNLNQINQLNQIAVLQAQAAQPRPTAAIDPRLQGTRPGLFPNALSPMMAAAAANQQPTFQNSSLTAAALNAAISRALSPQPQMAAPITSLNSMKTDGNNLSKWFGNDLIKQQLPNMPPLPAQGQKVMTVDEIERRSQTVTN